MNMKTALELYGQKIQPQNDVGIRWGSYRFSIPATLLFDRTNVSHRDLLNRLHPPGVPGLYTIMIKNSLQPEGFELLYVGQSDDVYYRPSKRHENFDDWYEAAKGATLYVSYLEMIGSTEHERRLAEDSIIKRYNPVCNAIGSVAQKRFV